MELGYVLVLVLFIAVVFLLVWYSAAAVKGGAAAAAAAMGGARGPGAPRNAGKSRGAHKPAGAAYGSAPLLRAFAKIPHFGPLSDAEIEAARHEAGRTEQAYTRQDIVASWRMHVAELSRGFNYGKVRAALARRGLVGGPNPSSVATANAVIAVSAETRASPMAVVRTLRSLGVGLAPEALRAIEAADLGSRHHSLAAQAESKRYEDAVAARLRASGAPPFKTEDDLRREWSAAQSTTAAGAALLTPDFVFDPPWEYTDAAGKVHSLHWADAKNYPCFDSRLVLPGLRAAARKYTERFGPGAFIFNGSVDGQSQMAAAGALVISWPA